MEWNYNLDEIPKDGRLIIGLVKDTELGMSILSYKDQCIPWESNNGNYHTEDIAAWMPAPEPPEKSHECIYNGFICSTNQSGRILLGCRDKFTECNYCPFCGEKANG